MPRGGRREGSGRKIRSAPPLTKGLAKELYNDPTTKQRWQAFRDAKDPWLQFSAEKFIWEQAEGKAVQREDVDGQLKVDAVKRERIRELLSRLAGKSQ